MADTDKKPPEPFRLEDYKSYGSDERDEVGGGPAGRGSDGRPAGDTGRDWGRGDRPDLEETPDVAPPEGVARPKNPFSP